MKMLESLYSNFFKKGTRRLRGALRDAVKSNALAYAGILYLRQLLGLSDVPKIHGDFPGNDKFLREYGKCHSVRLALLECDEIMLRRLIVANEGYIVPCGPFSGMSFESCAHHFSAAMMLGTYEMELWPHIEAAIERDYDAFVNIGCSYGYYAVGLARRTSGTRIVACDADPQAREICARLAAENGVTHNMVITDRFDGKNFEDYATHKTLILCDIEGTERDLMDPAKFTALKTLDLIVELHDVYDPSISKTILSRFNQSHDVKIVREGIYPSFELPKYLARLGSLERFIACHGGKRWGPTPWAVMLTPQLI